MEGRLYGLSLANSNVTQGKNIALLVVQPSTGHEQVVATVQAYTFRYLTILLLR